MNNIFQDLDFIFVYIDDILIASKSKEEHTVHLHEVFKRLAKHDIKVKYSKCVFGVQSIEFLSHTISDQGITPSAEKVQVIQSFPTPTNLKQVQRVVGMINYYHRFLPKVSDKLKPLHTLIAEQSNKKTKNTIPLDRRV